jgi:hypothetical protein
MNSWSQFVIEGVKQAGKVFAVSLFLLLLAVLPSWLSIANGFDADPSQSFLGLLLVLDWIVAALFGSLLAGPVPWLLTHFDISDKQLLILSCLLVIPYWVLLGAGSGFARWGFFAERSPEQPDPQLQKVSKKTRLLVEGFALAIAVFFFFDGPLVYTPRSGPHFSSVVIVNNIRQIDAAKNEFALEHKVDPGYVPTVADLSPFIRLRDGDLPHYGPENYVINAISNLPYANLTNDMWVPRRGWKEGFLVGTNGTIFRLPAQTPAKQGRGTPNSNS